MSDQSQGIYVYGVARADADLGILGGDEAAPDVRVIEVGDLVAIVSSAGGEDEASVRESVLAHARVLERATESATVLPMRFGMVFPDDQAVARDLLDARHDDLVRLLDEFEGRVQVTLKVNYREDAVLREILSEEPEIARVREATRKGGKEETHNDRVRLGEMLDQAIEQRRERDSAAVLEPLEELAVATASGQLEKEFMVLNAPFLVERRRLQEFDDALEELAQERIDLMHFRLLGPMPAYDFVSWEQPAWA